MNAAPKILLCVAATIAVVDGRRRRKILEDELRRTLLKGMVTMNMEALSVFSSAAAADEKAARRVPAADRPDPPLMSAPEPRSGEPPPCSCPVPIFFTAPMPLES